MIADFSANRDAVGTQLGRELRRLAPESGGQRGVSGQRLELLEVGDVLPADPRAACRVGPRLAPLGAPMTGSAMPGATSCRSPRATRPAPLRPSCCPAARTLSGKSFCASLQDVRGPGARRRRPERLARRARDLARRLLVKAGPQRRDARLILGDALLQGELAHRILGGGHGGLELRVELLVREDFRPVGRLHVVEALLPQ